ncbi:MAG: NIL domain-containing protein [Methanomassiliicoccales archaeon]
MSKNRYLLTFSPDLVDEPITYRLVRDFDLMINILRAEIDDRGGRLLIAFEGDAQQIKGAVKYLSDNKVVIQELNEFVLKDVKRCTDCGMCVSICPAHAFEVDGKTWKVLFHGDRCIACGMCIEACPPGAMKLGT